MADWVKVEHDADGWPMEETMPPDGALVDVLRRFGEIDGEPLTYRNRGEVRRVTVGDYWSDDTRHDSFEVRSRSWKPGDSAPTYEPLPDCPFDDEPTGVGDYWRLIECE